MDALEARRLRLQRALDTAGLDAIVVTSPTNLFYLAGFRPETSERLIAVVFTASGSLRMVCPALEEALALSVADDSSEVYLWRDDEGPTAALRQAVRGLGRRIAIETRGVSFAHGNLISAAAKGIVIVGGDDLLVNLRAIKSDEEIAAIRAAVGVVDQAMSQIRAIIASGVTEEWLARESLRLLREAGADGLPFKPVFATGSRSSLALSRPTPTKLAEGELLIVDIGATVDCYGADITRTYVVDAEPSERQRTVFDVVREAQLAAIAHARAGARASEVDAAARNLITAAGYGPNFTHRTGHGLGLEAHEGPFLASTNDQVLEPGMVVTVEPGIYIKGWGGVRIEDDVLIAEAGPEVLTRSPVALSLTAQSQAEL
jgi:Xaa-Pro dipeptidase